MVNISKRNNHTCHKCLNHCPCPTDKNSRCGFNVYFALCGKERNLKKKKHRQKENVSDKTARKNHTEDTPPKNRRFSFNTSITEKNECDNYSGDSFLDEKEETNIELGSVVQEGKGSPVQQRNSFEQELKVIIARLDNLESKFSKLENKGANNTDSDYRLGFKTQNSRSTVSINKWKTARDRKQRRYLSRTDNRRSGGKKMKSWQINSHGPSPDGYETSVSVQRRGKKYTRYCYSDSSSSESEEE